MNLHARLNHLEAKYSSAAPQHLDSEGRLERVKRLYKFAHDKYAALPLDQTPQAWQRVQELLTIARKRKELTQ